MKPTIPESRYVDSNTRGKAESKKVEKISQNPLTQIKGRNPRVQLSCRKVYFYFLWRRAYHMCSHMGVCVRGKGDRQESQKSRATVYRAILQSGEFLHIQSGCSSYPHYISRERVSSDIMSEARSQTLLDSGSTRALWERGQWFHYQDFGGPCQLSNPQERDPNALSPCCPAFSRTLGYPALSFPIPLSARYRTRRPSH